jgi:hypothetical protein
MLDWLALLSLMAILAGVAIFAFGGCTVLCPLEPPDAASRFSFRFYVRFDPALAGASDGSDPNNSRFGIEDDDRTVRRVKFVVEANDGSRSMVDCVAPVACTHRHRR